MSFTTHTKRKKEFILFLTKLTSILFLPFYSNIIKAVEAHEKEREREFERVSEEEKQFVTVYHSEKGRKKCVCYVWRWRKEEEKTIEETRLLILHEMDSKLYNV